jgi:hypothetical protein
VTWDEKEDRKGTTTQTPEGAVEEPSRTTAPIRDVATAGDGMALDGLKAATTFAGVNFVIMYV